MNCLIWKQANSALKLFNVELRCEIHLMSQDEFMGAPVPTLLTSSPEQNHSVIQSYPQHLFCLRLRYQTNPPFRCSPIMKTLILMVRKIECSQPGSSFTAMTVIFAASGRKQGEHCTFLQRRLCLVMLVTFTFTCALVSAPPHAYGEEQTGFTATAG